MKILVVTNSCGGLPQKLHETESLDIGAICAELSAHGHVTEVIDHARLVRLEPEALRGTVVMYASSQHQELYQYIEHCLLYAETCGAHLMPGYLCFRAHENKFIQEILKRKLGLASPASRLYGTIEEVVADIGSIAFPVVLKYPQGFASVGVSKVDSPEELLAELNARMVETVAPPARLVHRFTERRQYREAVARYTGRYPLKSRRIVLQEFLPGLDHDWKVLVFGNRIFCLKRRVRANDFRASGSGNFSFDEVPPEGLLDFAAQVLRTLDTPWASLDIAVHAGKCHLIEFQCVHFGLVTLMRGKAFYSLEGGSWQRHPVSEAQPEPFFSQAALDYLATRFPAG